MQLERFAELVVLVLLTTLPLHSQVSAVDRSVFNSDQFTAADSWEDTPIPTNMEGFRSEHPRMLFSDADLGKIRQKIGTDAFAESEYQRLLARSEALLTIPPHQYRKIGPDQTLLPVVRDIEDRIFTLAGVYRITGDRRFAQRAIVEMLSAAAFPDWNPSHFLDTAEMSTALGVGYDWLYPVLTPEQREIIRNAEVHKGIDVFLGRLHRRDVHYRNNWGQVCYGGITIGALAIAEPNDAASLDRAREMVGYARSGIAILMQLFSPDGGFDEGPVYWNYATIYNVLYIAALDSALGTDFEAATAPGFDLTPEYRIQSLGPSFQFANFSDASPWGFPSPQMYWFAHRFHRPDYAAYEQGLTQKLRGKMKLFSERESVRFDVFGLFWYALGPLPEMKTLPRVKRFSRIDQAFMRTSWTDSHAWYVALKGGEATASHGHLDLGTFILDGLGERWAIDLGAEGYAMPGYFGKQRWNYYRAQTQGHNTLTVNGPNEDPDASAIIQTAKAEGGEEIAIANLDRTYKERLRSWRRGVAILGGDRVLVQDEISPRHPVDVIWHFHTDAAVSMSKDQRSVTLTKDGVSIEARLLSPGGAHFGTASAQPPSPQAENPGVTDLVIHQAQISSQQTIAVEFSEPNDHHQEPLVSLSKWGRRESRVLASTTLR
jgi:Heparinase II/III-like protein